MGSAHRRAWLFVRAGCGLVREGARGRDHTPFAAPDPLAPGPLLRFRAIVRGPRIVGWVTEWNHAVPTLPESEVPWSFVRLGSHAHTDRASSCPPSVLCGRMHGDGAAGKGPEAPTEGCCGLGHRAERMCVKRMHERPPAFFERIEASTPARGFDAGAGEKAPGHCTCCVELVLAEQLPSRCTCDVARGR